MLVVGLAVFVIVQRYKVHTIPEITFQDLVIYKSRFNLKMSEPQSPINQRTLAIALEDARRSGQPCYFYKRVAIDAEENEVYVLTIDPSYVTDSLMLYKVNKGEDVPTSKCHYSVYMTSQ